MTAGPPDGSKLDPHDLESWVNQISWLPRRPSPNMLPLSRRRESGKVGRHKQRWPANLVHPPLKTTGRVKLLNGYEESCPNPNPVL